MPLSNISAVIITRDAGSTIRNTLDSLRDFGEVVVFDNGSEDDTRELAKSYGNVSLHCGEFMGFGKTKAHAVSLARNDWVFSIDADESVSDALSRSLDELPLEVATTAYQVLRHNYFMGKHVAHGGWGNDWLLRLFNRRHHNFNAAPVHEQVVLGGSGRMERLSGSIDHNAVQNIGQFLVNINRYSEINRQAGKKAVSLILIVAKTWFAFFRSYVLQLGFLDGWRGMIIARCRADGTFFKYMKPFADSRVAKEKRQG
jgi:glycosyltransferase involved in cell wall biosynthesis